MTSTPAPVSAAALPRQRSARPVLTGVSFAAIDAETISSRLGAICSIGVVVVRAGVVVDGYEGLCRPHAAVAEADWRHMAVNNLSLGDIRAAGGFGDLLAVVDAFVGDLPVLVHGAEKHLKHVRAACDATGTPRPAWRYACTEELARTVLHQHSHALADVAAALALPRFTRHQALADARATAGAALALAERTGATDVDGLVGGQGVSWRSVEG